MSRFSLLHLEHEEVLLESLQATLRPLFDAEEKARPAMDCRLFVASRSLYCEPRDASICLTRFPFKQMPTEPAEWSDGASIVLRALKRVEFFPNRPVVHQKSPQTLIVAPKHTQVPKLLALLKELWQISQKSKHANDPIERGLLAAIVQPRLQETFDKSRLVDFRERILAGATSVLSVERVEPMVNSPGVLVLTDKRLYFQPARVNNLQGTRVVSSWDVAAVAGFAKRRYMQEQRGLEVAFTGGGAVLLAFRDGRDARDEAFQRLAELLPALAQGAGDALADACARWQAGALSNYDYLWLLNRAADRSLDDLTQYPVFPWVLCDYESPALDLADPAVFRDLAKPVGALNPRRLAVLKERFATMDPAGDPPPFLYGTHYSSPAAVLFFLVRERPAEMLRLQSGSWDAPDRMFHSVAGAWANVTTNQADVKELVPQFYSGDGAFLVNHKALDFGRRESDGQRVGDVVLPPWAASPADFVRQLRAALESDAVSRQLHAWIDLVFGCKQTGAEAARADNVFFHLTYEGSVDPARLADAERASFETQVMEFGQTPKKLFAAPHPPRSGGPGAVLGAPLEDTNVVTAAAAAAAASEEADWPALPSEAPAGAAAHRVAVTGVLDDGAGGILSVAMDGSLVRTSGIRGQVTQRVRISKLALSCATRFGDELVLGGWDNAVHRYSASAGRVVGVIEMHEDAVACLSARASLLVSGGWDACVRVWNAGFEPVCAFHSHAGPVVAVALASDERRVLSSSTASAAVLLHDVRVGPDAVLQCDAGGGGAVLAWAGATRALTAARLGGVRLFDLRKPASALLRSGEEGWAPTQLQCNGKAVAVGDASGRVHAGALDALESLAFESCVVARLDGEVTALAASARAIVAGTAKGKVYTIAAVKPT